MLRSLALAAIFALGFASAAQADFILGPATGHISGSASDFSGVDSFTSTVPLPLGLNVMTDFAMTPSALTESHADLTTTLSVTLIEALGGAVGGTAVTGAGPLVTGLAEFSVDFSLSEATLVLWDFSTVTGLPGTVSTVSLTGPSGIVPTGAVMLDPGDYTIFASAGYTAFPPPVGVSVFAHYALSLEIVPAPGALALLACAALLGSRRRRRC